MNEVTWKDLMLSGWFWIHGLIGAVVGGIATSVALIITDPANYNLEAGLPKLISVVKVAAIVNAALYLKANPMPGIKQDIAAKKALSGT